MKTRSPGGVGVGVGPAVVLGERLPVGDGCGVHEMVGTDMINTSS